MVLKLEGAAHCSPFMLFSATLWCSAYLGGKPVRCTGLLPGVSLHVHAHFRVQDHPDINDVMAWQWEDLRPSLEQWIEVADRLPCLALDTPWAEIKLALDGRVQLEAGVMQIDVLPPWRWGRG